MMARAKRWTERELERLPKDDGKYELVAGELVLTPPEFLDHGIVCADLGYKIGTHVWTSNLGCVVGGKVGFWMTNGNLRSPDISFVSKERLAVLEPISKIFLKGAPDLAIEIISPRDSKNQLDEKLADYFLSGTKLAWVIDLKSRSASIHCEPVAKRTIADNEVLDGEDVVPGFSLKLRELFRTR